MAWRAKTGLNKKRPDGTEIRVEPGEPLPSEWGEPAPWLVEQGLVEQDVHDAPHVAHKGKG